MDESKRGSKRRAWGEGGLMLRPDGLWMATYSRTEGGKRQRKCFYGRTKEEARSKLREYVQLLERGITDVSRDTVVAFSERWLEHVRPTVRPSTFAFYEDFIHRYALGVIGDMPLTKVTPLHVEAVIKALRDDKKSSRILHNTHVILGRMFDRAVKWKMIPFNPVDGVDRPKWEKGQFQVWTKEQALQFLKGCQDHRLYGLFVLAIYTGMRQGEILGLQWSDVDLKAGTVTVRHQLQEVRGKILGLGEPKTKTGARTIGLNAACLKALRGALALALEEGTAQGFVFLNSAGKPYRKSSVIHSFWYLCRVAKVAKIRFHDLRHTNATLMIEGGADLKTVQHRLGHSQLNITADTYTKYTKKMDERAMSVLENMLG